MYAVGEISVGDIANNHEGRWAPQAIFSKSLFLKDLEHPKCDPYDQDVAGASTPTSKCLPPPV